MWRAAARPRLVFLLLVAFVLAAESTALASRAMASHPQAVRAAVLFDLSLVPAALWWALVVRRGLARPRTVARVAVAFVALCALLFGREVRLLAIPLELALIWLAAVSVRRALLARRAADAASALRAGLADALGDSALARALAAELAVFWYALFSWGRPAPAGSTAYKRAGWVAIYCAILLACAAEAIPLHFLFRRWGPLAAGLSLAVHVYTALWLIGDLRALVLRPLRVEGGTLLLRIGLRWEADIPLSSVVKVERGPAAEGRRLGVLGTPNLTLWLREPQQLIGPFGIRKTARVLQLQVDDPDRLAAALA
ncbi:MAG TPA: hypothetical protein VMK66_19255 [Myxococcales bacterium]|nr:hypothetical protein [Myxococcales bacterium]